MGGYDGSIRIRALLNHSPFDRGIRSMSSSAKALQSTLMKLAGAVGLAFGTAALAKFAKDSIRLASDIQEVQNVIDVTFGRGAEQVEAFAQSAAAAFGLSELSAKQYVGTLGAMLKSSGLAAENAREMSIALTGLAGDIASFYNLDTDTAFEKIRSGISGETEPLKQLGINMSVANLEAYALSKGITKSYNVMSQAEQVLLRYNYLLSVTTDAQGDFARTAGSFANQIRILQLNFDQLKISLGNAMLPIAQEILPGINAVIAKLTELARVFAQVTSLLFGSGTEEENRAAESAGELAEATEGVGDAAEETEKKLKGLLAGFDTLNILGGKSAEDLDSVSEKLGLEDLNQTAGMASGNLFEGMEVDPGLLASVERLRQALEQLRDFASGIWGVFSKSWEKWGDRVLDAFKNAARSVWELMKSIGRAFSAVWTGEAGLKFLDAFYGHLEMILGIASDIASAFKIAWDNDNVGTEFIESIFFKLTEILKLLTSIGQAFREAWNDGTGVEICETILRIFTNLNNAVGTLAGKLREAWEANRNGVSIWEAVLGMVHAVLLAINRMAEATRRWAEGLDLEPLVSASRKLLEALEPLVGIITGSLAWAYENVLLPFAEWLAEQLAPVAVDVLTAAFEVLAEVIESLRPLGTWLWETFLQPLGSWSGEILVTALQKLADGLRSIGDWISKNQELIQNLVLLVGSLAGAIWTAHTAVSSFSGIFKSLLDITGAVGSAISFLASPIGLVTLAIGAVIAAILLLIKYWDDVKNAAGVAWDFIEEKWAAAGEWIQANILDPVSQAFSGFVNGLFMMVENIVNFFVTGVNAIISALNSIQFSVPEWVPLIGGKDFGFHIPEVPSLKLPRLANGAVIPPNQQFAAILGDQRSGTNIETPLTTMKQAFLEAIGESGLLHRQSGGGTVTLNIDGKTFARITLPYLQEERGRVGVNLIAGGSL